MKHLIRAALAAAMSLVAGMASAAAINMSTATTSLISTAGSSALQVTAFGLSASGATTAKFEYGTQTTNPCDTGTTALTGSFQFGANTEITSGDGLGDILSVPAGKQLCIVQTGSVTLAGFLTYSPF